MGFPQPAAGAGLCHRRAGPWRPRRFRLGSGTPDQRSSCCRGCRATPSRRRSDGALCRRRRGRTRAPGRAGPAGPTRSASPEAPGWTLHSWVSVGRPGWRCGPSRWGGSARTPHHESHRANRGPPIVDGRGDGRRRRVHRRGHRKTRSSRSCRGAVPDGPRRRRRPHPLTRSGRPSCPVERRTSWPR
jgi:hypothetical protein